MEIHEGDVLLGTVDPVPVLRGGSEVHLAHFAPADATAHKRRQLGRLMLAEILHYIVENFTSVQAVSFSLGRDLGIRGDASRLATARSSLLQGLGVQHTVVTPRPDASHAGHFVVEGLWEYNPESLRALRALLQQERQAHAAMSAHRGGEGRLRAARRWLRERVALRRRR